MTKRDIRIVAHDIRSTHNIGALLRTAECMGVSHIYFTGYTPYPMMDGDKRMPHLAAKINRQIHKTALGAESMVPWTQSDTVLPVLEGLRDSGYAIVALEQSPASVALPGYSAPDKIALLIGREVEGIEEALLAECSDIVEIPQFGRKESLNVVQAAAMALYSLRFTP